MGEWLYPIIIKIKLQIHAQNAARVWLLSQQNNVKHRILNTKRVPHFFQQRLSTIIRIELLRDFFQHDFLPIRLAVNWCQLAVRCGSVFWHKAPRKSNWCWQHGRLHVTQYNWRDANLDSIGPLYWQISLISIESRVRIIKFMRVCNECTICSVKYTQCFCFGVSRLCCQFS